MKVVLVFAVIAALINPALGQTPLQRMQMVNALGSLLASEEPCGLRYDQGAIAAYIDGNVPADDMNFASSLQVTVLGQGYQIGKMTPSSKTAHCAQTARVAKAYHFIP